MSAELRVAVAGLGAVGMRVATALDGKLDGLVLSAVSAQDHEAAATRLCAFSRCPPVVPLAELADRGEIVVECLPPARFRDIAEPVLSRGNTLIAASAGALFAAEDLIDLGRQNRARILVPSGALAGLDGLRAGAEAGLESVTLVSRKPPRAFGDSVWARLGQDPDRLTEPARLFAGSAREAVRQFPENINVAATASLAGLGPDRTRVEIWADPHITENRHELSVRSAAGSATNTSVNLPDPDNPRSSIVTAYSIVATLRTLTSTLCVGS